MTGTWALSLFSGLGRIRFQAVNRGEYVEVSYGDSVIARLQWITDVLYQGVAPNGITPP